MLALEYLESARECFGQVERQLPAINRAAETIAGSIEQGGMLHLYDTGHVLKMEAIHRAGGLLAVAPLSFRIDVNNPMTVASLREVNPTSIETRILVTRAALDLSHLRSGDVLLIGSVTGSTCEPVELGLEAKRRGIATIGFTSPVYEFEGRAVPEHPSQRFLREVVDEVLEVPGPIGDAVLDVPGMDAPVCPISGVGTLVLFWCLMAQTVEQCLSRNIKLSVWRKIHIPAADEFNDTVRERYQQLGY